MVFITFVTSIIVRACVFSLLWLYIHTYDLYSWCFHYCYRCISIYSELYQSMLIFTVLLWAYICPYYCILAFAHVFRIVMTYIWLRLTHVELFLLFTILLWLWIHLYRFIMVFVYVFTHAMAVNSSILSNISLGSCFQS